MSSSRKQPPPAPRLPPPASGGGQFFQVSFSDQAMAELNKLPIPEQMKMVEQITSLTPAQLNNPGEPLGRFTRDGRTYFRLRIGDFRCYFEKQAQTIQAHYFLHRNTLTDFVFRFKLPITEEQMIEQQGSFWKYLETIYK